MSVNITLYFEDIVSEIGLWKSFVAKHMELYGKPLPFYTVGPDYDTDRIHVEDIRFLLWDALLADECSETMPNPENLAIEVAAHLIFAYLSAKFDDTPINEEFYNYIHEAPFASVFYEVRLVLNWYYFDCYLTAGRYGRTLFLDDFDRQLELCHGDVSVAQTAVGAAVAFNYRIGPLALKPQEWLASLLRIHGQNEKADAVGSIVSRKLEPYSLEGFDARTITLRDSGGMPLTLRRTKYLDETDSLLGSKDVNGCVGTFALYDGEWYLNGMNSWGDMTRFLRDYKRELDLEDKEETALMETFAHTGKRLFFFESPKDFHGFLADTLHAPAAEGQRLPKGVKNVTMYIPESPKAESGEGRRGFNVIFDIAEYVKSPDNPMYDRGKAKDCFLIADIDNVPGGFVRYAISHNLFADFALNSTKGYRHGRRLAQDNLDFLARTLRRHEY